MTSEEQSSETTNQTTTKTDSIGIKELLVPISIAIAGAFVGLGLYFGGGTTDKDAAAQVAPPSNDPVAQQADDSTGNVNPVDENDWIKGNADAPIKIVEYSDYDCPFCSRFHDTMDEIVTESNGQVAWVYRHFPLDQLHPQARAVALAAECVGAEGGNDAFWQFTDRYFAVRGAQDSTPHGELIPQLVTETGVSQSAFTSCFENQTYLDEVQTDFDDAVETGGRGTPWSILIGPNGATYPVNGAQPKQAVEQIINVALQEA